VEGVVSADILDFDLTVAIEAIEFAGCGHLNYMSARFLTDRRKDTQRFYCCICGNTNLFNADKVGKETAPAMPEKQSLGGKIVQFVRRSKS
jgi:hypothetical protein